MGKMDSLLDRTRDTVNQLRKMRAAGLAMSNLNNQQSTDTIAHIFADASELSTKAANATVDYFETQKLSDTSEWDELLRRAQSIYRLQPATKWDYDTAYTWVEKMNWKYSFGPLEPFKILCAQNNIRDARFEALVSEPAGIVAPLSTDFSLVDIAITAAQRAGYRNLFLEAAINGINNSTVLFPFDNKNRNPFHSIKNVTVLVDGNPAGVSRPLLISRVNAMYPGLEAID